MRDNDDADRVARTPETPAQAYVAPHIERLGTLAELTKGGTVGPDDGDGGQGGDGSF